jgi:SAM-dependent methyltransferase
MAWFKNWFNEDYAKLYEHRDSSEASKIIGLYEKYCGHLTEKKVLDLACGLGRLSSLLAAKSKEVLAFDLSDYFIEECKKNHDEKNIDFLKMDMREMRWKREFDAVFHIFTSFGYFEDLEDNLKIFDNVYRALKSDGIYFFDFHNVDYLKENLIPETNETINNINILQKREIVGDRVVKKIIINSGNETRNYEESVQLIHHTVLDDYFRKLGFRIKAKLGNYDGELFNNEKSDRLIYILKKEWWIYEFLFK